MINMSNTLFWFNNYKNEMIVDNDYTEYIQKLGEQKLDNNMYIKINQLENDYLEKIKYIEDLYENNVKIENIKAKNSLLILQHELEIIKILSKYTLQNKVLNYNFFKICLLLLLEFSEILRIRLGQKEIIHYVKMNNTNNIIRCSYKFCTYQANCLYNYNLKSKQLCYQDHYVHNMVSADLKILLNYIKENTDSNNNIIHTKEILKTINTLSFVINQMETELRTKCLYSPEDCESYHIIKYKKN